ncbi:MAG: PorV/PorQ family protein [Candidatus Eisenbacteria bacterium]
MKRGAGLSAMAIGAVLTAAGVSANDQVGTRSFPFLRIGVGARAVGMGEAYTAVAEGAEGLEWNPAGIGQLNHAALSTEYMSYLEDIHGGSVVFAQPVGRRTTFGLSLRFFSIRDIPRTTLENPTGDGLGDFTSTDLCLKGSLAYRLGRNIFVGASGAIVTGAIDQESALAMSADFGLLMRNFWRRLRIGGTVRNFGTVNSGYLQEADPLPTRVAAAAAYPFFDRRLLVAGEWSWAVDWDNSLDVGVEWEGVTDFFLRAGYRSHFSEVRDRSEDGDLAGLTFGLGLRKIRGYRFDYAYASMADLGGTHRFSFSWVFK